MGKIKGLLNPFMVQEKVHEASYFNIIVTLMGGDLVLIDSECPQDTMEFVERAKESWSLYLSWVDQWSPRIMSRERQTWIKCFGIPAHVWEEKFFRFLFFGRDSIVEIDENTRNKRRLHVARF